MDLNNSIIDIFKRSFKYSGEITIDNDGLITVTGHCRLIPKCTKLPVKFDRVGGIFDCSGNHLETLIGSPRYVGNTFDCSINNLRTLEGAPTTVIGTFTCSHNYLTSLIGSPEFVGRAYFCSYNDLESFEGITPNIISDLFCYDNKLKSVTGLKSVGDEFHISVFDYNIVLLILSQIKANEIIFMDTDGNSIYDGLHDEFKQWIKYKRYRVTGRPWSTERMAELLLTFPS